jgi:hypothetical protein
MQIEADDKVICSKFYLQEIVIYFNVTLFPVEFLRIKHQVDERFDGKNTYIGFYKD